MDEKTLMEVLPDIGLLQVRVHSREGGRHSILRILRGRPHERERDTLQSEGRQGRRRNQGFPVRPTLEREAAGQEPQSATLGRRVRKANADHDRHQCPCSWAPWNSLCRWSPLAAMYATR